MQTVKELVTMDDGEMGPTGDKADYIKDEASGNLEMTVVEFCEDVVDCRNILADQPTESYVRRVLKECRPEAVAMFDTGEITFQ
jgi:hypothetical protein